jgi:hypothetical protein
VRQIQATPLFGIRKLKLLRFGANFALLLGAFLASNSLRWESVGFNGRSISDLPLGVKGCIWILRGPTRLGFLQN